VCAPAKREATLPRRDARFRPRLTGVPDVRARPHGRDLHLAKPPLLVLNRLKPLLGDDGLLVDA